MPKGRCGGRRALIGAITPWARTATRLSATAIRPAGWQFASTCGYHGCQTAPVEQSQNPVIRRGDPLRPTPETVSQSVAGVTAVAPRDLVGRCGRRTPPEANGRRPLGPAPVTRGVRALKCNGRLVTNPSGDSWAPLPSDMRPGFPNASARSWARGDAAD